MRVRHIRDRMVLISLLVVAPFVIWNIRTHVSRFYDHLDASLAAQQAVAEDVSVICTDYVHDVIALQRTVGATIWGDENPAPRHQLQSYLMDTARTSSRLAHLAVADNTGVIFASDVPALVGHNVSDRPSVRDVLMGADWAISDSFSPRMMRVPVAAVNVGIRDEEGRLQGMVIGVIHEGTIETALPPAFALADQIIITDSSGIVIVAHGRFDLTEDERVWTDHNFIRRALEGRRATVPRFRMPDGPEMVGSTVQIAELGWTASVFDTRDEVLGPARWQASMDGALTALLIGLAVGMAFYLGNRLARPIMAVAENARKLGEGNLDIRTDVHTGDEIEVLALNFNGMASALQQRTSELNRTLESERLHTERASSLYTIAQGLIVTMTLNDRLDMIAHALGSLCGTKRCIILLKKGSKLVGTAGWGLAHPESLNEISIDISDRARPAEGVEDPEAPLVVEDVNMDPHLDTKVAEKFSIKGYLALPLVRRRHLVGMAVLDSPGKAPHFDTETIETARGLANLIAIAIENAETFDKWVMIAQTLQKSLLPASPGKIGPFTFACKYAAAVELTELGGDFYDFIYFPDGRIGIVIADVSGKGLEAAIATAMGKYTLRAFLLEDPDPGVAFSRANDAIACHSSDWGFVTMFYGLLDPRTGRLTYANAGHPPALVLRASGHRDWLVGTGTRPPLGVMKGMDYTQAESYISEGDIIVGYTDGIIEARCNSDLFEIERIADVVHEHRYLDPDGIARAIHKAAIDFNCGRLQDDIALLVVKHNGI